MRRNKIIPLFLVMALCISEILTAPADSTNSLVVSSRKPRSNKESGKQGDLTEINQTVPKIYQMSVKSNVNNRFAHTTVTSKVQNIAEKSQQATFSVILPETAFISGFIMEVDGKNYTAYVKEKEEAKRTYDEAVASGLGAAHVAVSARDSNRFTVSVNVEPETKAAFYLSYEELLRRQDGHYELVINLHPGQPVKDLNVEVIIAESRKLTNLKAPPLRSGNEIGTENGELDPRADLEITNDTSAIVRFTPNIERQKQLAHLLGTNENNGLAGQFVVQYDVERDPKGGEVLVQDGYFVHFFAPSQLTPLPKHVVFVLDTSSSMDQQKIEQLKKAMFEILGQLHENDLLHLVEFNSNIKVWNLDNEASSVWYPQRHDFQVWEQEMYSLDKLNFPRATTVNADNIKKAKATISKFDATGSTDIFNALKVGLRLVELRKQQRVGTNNHQPMIIFLTDGEPTVRVTSSEDIVSGITEYNSDLRKSPIFALSFGNGADKKFLQKLALRNSGFTRHIYEAADASLQLQNFYHGISSPLLTNVTFKYEPSTTSLTETSFPVHFDGSELVVTGKCTVEPFVTLPFVDAWDDHQFHSFQPTVKRSVTSIERLWAFLTVKQLLEKKERSDKEAEELKKKALDLALQYSFVTSVSSLVVVKPDATNAVDAETADIGYLRPNLLNSNSRPTTNYYPDSFVSYDSVDSISSNRFMDFDNGPIDFRTTGLTDDAENADDRIFKHSPASSKTSTLLTTLPWLKNILNENGTLSLPTGNYKLGLNETISDTVTCTKTPFGTVGHCTLLNSCPEVYSLLTNLNKFVQHFCLLKDEYAGICCPGSS